MAVLRWSNSTDWWVSAWRPFTYKWNHAILRRGYFYGNVPEFSTSRCQALLQSDAISRLWPVDDTSRHAKQAHCVANEIAKKRIATWKSKTTDRTRHLLGTKTGNISRAAPTQANLLAWSLIQAQLVNGLLRRKLDLPLVSWAVWKCLSSRAEVHVGNS